MRLYDRPQVWHGKCGGRDETWTSGHEPAQITSQRSRRCRALIGRIHKMHIISSFSKVWASACAGGHVCSDEGRAMRKSRQAKDLVVDCGDVRKSRFNSPRLCITTGFSAMVFIDNTVALHQLELANAAILAQTNTQVYEGSSLAKDGKFHPRVLTLVRTLSIVHNLTAFSFAICCLPGR